MSTYHFCGMLRPRAGQAVQIVAGRSEAATGNQLGRSAVPATRSLEQPPPFPPPAPPESEDDHEDVKVLETISWSAAKLILRSLQRRADREKMDSYQELLKLDDFNEPEGQ